MTARRPASRLPAIDPDRCTGCGRCVAACEPRALSLETRADWRKSALLHAADDCTGCSLRLALSAADCARPSSRRWPPAAPEMGAAPVPSTEQRARARRMKRSTSPGSFPTICTASPSAWRDTARRCTQ